MTAEQARRELPPVRVKMPDGKIYPARVSGRLNQFATVTISYVWQPHRRKLADFGGQPWIDGEWSWEAVARAVSEDRPLVYA